MATKNELLATLLARLSHREIEDLVSRTAAENEPPPVDWTKTQKTCPRCGRTGPVIPDFGVKKIRDMEHPQSWCLKCRGETSKEYYHAKRKNKITRRVHGV